MSSTTDTLIKKHLTRVESAGVSANALGWVSLALVAGVVWLFSDPNEVWGIWILSMPICYYFIKTGKYIKNFSGHYMKLFLYLNGIFALLLARGLIPLIVSVQSFMGGYSLGVVDQLDPSVSVKSLPSGLSSKEKIIFALFLAGSLVSTYIRAKNLQ